MTVFIGVEGAVQHGLSIIAILLILVLFTSCFPAYVFMLSFSTNSTSIRSYFRAGS